MDSSIFYTAEEAALMTEIHQKNYIRWIVQETLEEISKLIEKTIEGGQDECFYLNYQSPNGLIMIPVKERLEKVGYIFENIGKTNEGQNRYKISWRF